MWLFVDVTMFSCLAMRRLCCCFYFYLVRVDIRRNCCTVLNREWWMEVEHCHVFRKLHLVLQSSQVSIPFIIFYHFPYYLLLSYDFLTFVQSCDVITEILTRFGLTLPFWSISTFNSKTLTSFPPLNWKILTFSTKNPNFELKNSKYWQFSSLSHTNFHSITKILIMKNKFWHSNENIDNFWPYRTKNQNFELKYSKYWQFSSLSHTNFHSLTKILIMKNKFWHSNENFDNFWPYRTKNQNFELKNSKYWQFSSLPHTNFHSITKISILKNQFWHSNENIDNFWPYRTKNQNFDLKNSKYW